MKKIGVLLLALLVAVTIISCDKVRGNSFYFHKYR